MQYQSSTSVGEPARNLSIHEPIDRAAWLWHPSVAVDEPAFLRFRCPFESDGTPLRFHVTADQHFVLFLDGRRIARGPARSDVPHWFYASVECALSAGPHVLEAEVWWIGAHAPLSIMTHRGGFALYADEPYRDAISTGRAPWRVARRRGTSFSKHEVEAYVVVGDRLHVDAAEWHRSGKEWTDPVVIRSPVISNAFGVDGVGGWKCYLDAVPPLTDTRYADGRVRALIADDEAGVAVTEAHVADGRIQNWQALISEGRSVEVPPRARWAVLWDLEQYCCGYYAVRMRNGAGSRIACRWAESLYAPGTMDKGNRDEVVGKVFRGLGDSYTTDGALREWTPYWVGAGRYLMLEIQTGDEPLSIEDWHVQEQRYPLELSAKLDLADPELHGVIPLCMRALQCSSHDHLMDCPHYEQLMYVGDTRLELLTLYAVTDDSRLAERCLTLQDYSRAPFGFVAGRYPSREDQLLPAFSAIATCCLRDYALWRSNADFVRARLPGMRANLDAFLPYRGASGLLEELPGWAFIDWVEEWEKGCGPGHKGGCCALTNLFYLLALQAAAELEHHFGAKRLAQYYKEAADDLGKAIHRRFWNPARRAMADDLEQQHYSQHGQSLAVIAGLVPDAQMAPLMRGTLRASDFAPASIYFRHYVFEALFQSKLGKELRAAYQLWIDLKERGLFTTIEQDEPTRSDCHGWGAHALYHLVASLAGVRPDGPGFEGIRIAPVPNGLHRIDLDIPHPRGRVRFDATRDNGVWHGRVTVPAGCRVVMASDVRLVIREEEL